jgi:uncharacterized protein (TIGR02271 family)
MSMHVEKMIGRSAVDVNGAKVGKVGQIYLDDESDQPVWVTVHTGLFGAKESFAPLHGSSVDGDELRLAVTEDLVRDAPHVDADGHLSAEENDALHQHYARYLGAGGARTGYAGGRGEYAGAVGHETSGHDTSGPNTYGHDTSGPNTDDAMTRSEERLHVGVERVEGRRARLRKYVVTENVTRTVPLRHEEVRIVREPITDANRAQATFGADITSEEYVVILHAERPVVAKEIVAVERIRLATETVTEQRQVSTTLRKEQIDETVDIIDETDPKK